MAAPLAEDYQRILDWMASLPKLPPDRSAQVYEDGSFTHTLLTVEFIYKTIAAASDAEAEETRAGAVLRGSRLARPTPA